MKKRVIIVFFLLSFCLASVLSACAPVDAPDVISADRKDAAWQEYVTAPSEGSSENQEPDFTPAETAPKSEEDTVSEVYQIVSVPEFYQSLSKEINGFRLGVSKVEKTYITEIFIQDISTGTIKKYSKRFSSIKSFIDIFTLDGKTAIITAAGKNCGEISVFDTDSGELLNECLISSYVFDETRGDVFYVSYDEAGKVFSSCGTLTAIFDTSKQIVELSVNSDGTFSGALYSSDGDPSLITSSDP